VNIRTTYRLLFIAQLGANLSSALMVHGYLGMLNALVIWFLLFVPCSDPTFGTRGKYFVIRQLTIWLFGIAAAIGFYWNL
jgi:hypothetical protein